MRRGDETTRRREFVGAKNFIAKWIKQHKESPMKQKVNEPVGGGLSACSKKNCARTAANMRKPKKNIYMRSLGAGFLVQCTARILKKFINRRPTSFRTGRRTRLRTTLG